PASSATLAPGAGRTTPAAFAAAGTMASPAAPPPAAADPLATARFVELVTRAVVAEATDLFVSSATDARMRVSGALHELPASRFDEASLLALFALDDAQRARLDAHGSVDIGLHVEGHKLRVNVFRHRGGLAAAIRPLRRIRSLAELGLPPDLATLSELS